jgi:Na+-translocating ferredoxin:NAD+ oxidoreductase RNF subunit RnfB
MCTGEIRFLLSDCYPACGAGDARAAGSGVADEFVFAVEVLEIIEDVVYPVQPENCKGCKDYLEKCEWDAISAVHI